MYQCHFPHQTSKFFFIILCMLSLVKFVDSSHIRTDLNQEFDNIHQSTLNHSIAVHDNEVDVIKNMGKSVAFASGCYIAEQCLPSQFSILIKMIYMMSFIELSAQYIRSYMYVHKKFSDNTDQAKFFLLMSALKTAIGISTLNFLIPDGVRGMFEWQDIPGVAILGIGFISYGTAGIVTSLANLNYSNYFISFYRDKNGTIQMGILSRKIYPFNNLLAKSIRVVRALLL